MGTVYSNEMFILLTKLNKWCRASWSLSPSCVGARGRGARVSTRSLVGSISTRRWLRVLWSSLIGDLCHKASLMISVVGDSLNPTIWEVNLVAALHLTQVILCLRLGERVPAVVVLHTVLVLERLGRQLLHGNDCWTISSLSFLNGLLLILPVDRDLFPGIVLLGHLLPVDRHLLIAGRSPLRAVSSRPRRLLLGPLLLGGARNSRNQYEELVHGCCRSPH